MIKGQRVSRNKSLNQSKYGQQCYDEIGERKKEGAKSGDSRAAVAPQNKKQENHRCRRQIRSPMPVIDLPARIDRHKRIGPEQLAKIKPDGVTSCRQTLRPRT